MGKALHQSHLNFFTTKMDEHNSVVNWHPIEDQHEYLFRIRRKLSGSESDVIVHLTDAYQYGLAEFFARPKQIGTGSFVVMGMPNASTDAEVTEKAKEHGIGIGHIGRFMGALNSNKIWEYMTPDEKQRQEAEKQRRGAKA